VAVAPAPYGNYMGTPGSEGLLGPAHGHAHELGSRLGSLGSRLGLGCTVG